MGVYWVRNGHTKSRTAERIGRKAGPVFDRGARPGLEAVKHLAFLE